MVKNIIVSNHKDVDLEGEIISLPRFIELAGDPEGLDIEGDLYIDVAAIDEETFNAITEQIDNAIFFTVDGHIPSFVNGEFNIKKCDLKIKPTSMINEQSNQAENPNIMGLFENNAKMKEENFDYTESKKEAKVYLFGSSKGGTGKTFTCLISAYRFAKTHPDLRVAISDFDIIDGQVGITIHKIMPTMLNYYKKWKLGDVTFKTMEDFKVKSENFPSNIDFYLAPKDIYIEDDDFWNDIFLNLIENYDVVFFDSGIDYMHYKPISTLYKIADKIILVSTTSIKSVASVVKQISKLKGETENDVFSKEDKIGERLNLVITQANTDDEMNTTVYKTFDSKGINIIGIFGVITPFIQKAEYYGRWNIFDNNVKFNKILDNITS